jgi:hypothetical protein
MLTTTTETSTLHLGRSEVEDILFQQAEYIDSRNYEGWIDLFLPEGSYWIPARPGDTDPKRNSRICTMTCRAWWHVANGCWLLAPPGNSQSHEAVTSSATFVSVKRQATADSSFTRVSM